MKLSTLVLCATFACIHAQFLNIQPNAMVTDSTQKASIVVVSLGFKSNSGANTIFPSCEAYCVNNILWTNKTANMHDFLLENSNYQFTIDPQTVQYVSASVNLFASTLGCSTTNWATIARNYLLKNNGIDVNNYYFQVFLLPERAGGGSCTSMKNKASGPCAKGTLCPIFIRTSDPVDWIQGFTKSMGIAQNNDPTDATVSGWKLYNTFTRYKLGWVPENVMYNLTSASINPNASVNLNMISSSDSFKIFGNKVAFIFYKNSLYVSLRTCDNDSYDMFLNKTLCDKVYVHDNFGNVLTALSIGETYTNYNVDIVMNVVNVTFGLAVLNINFCQAAPFEPQLLTPSVSTRPATGFSTSILSLHVENPSMYCAPSTRNFSLGLVDKSLAENTCNNITVLIVPDFNHLEISYSVTSSSKVIMEGGYAANGMLSGGILINSTIYCGQYNELLTASFYDIGCDGYCCKYGGGSYYQVLFNGVIVKTGGEFKCKDVITFNNKLYWSVTVPSNTSLVSKVPLTIQSDSTSRIFRLNVL